MNANYTTINAADQLKDPDSIYHYNQRVIALRHSAPAFIYGDYQDVDPKNEQIFAYMRTLGEAKYLVVLNFSSKPIDYTLPGGLTSGVLRLGNYRDTADSPGSTVLHLLPWEARVFKQ